jgi:hypothetical protein
MPDPGLTEPVAQLRRDSAHARAQVAAARARTVELREQYEQVMAQTQAVMRITVDAWRQRRSSPAGRTALQRSEYLRLATRLETMPVIEQAKGIIMAESRCSEAEAFDLLRRASQRSNVPVRDLAAGIVAKATGTATPAARPEVEKPLATL